MDISEFFSEGEESEEIQPNSGGCFQEFSSILCRESKEECSRYGFFSECTARCENGKGNQCSCQGECFSEGGKGPFSIENSFPINFSSSEVCGGAASNTFPQSSLTIRYSRRSFLSDDITSSPLVSEVLTYDGMESGHQSMVRGGEALLISLLAPRKAQVFFQSKDKEDILRLPTLCSHTLCDKDLLRRSRAYLLGYYKELRRQRSKTSTTTASVSY
jgi:hypothetical protein